MQSAATSLSAQTEIAKTMQPHSAQNMILPANKKTKKYAPQLSSKQTLPQTAQPQFQINKTYNVVSILKTSAAASTQQQPSHLAHQQQPHHLPLQQAPPQQPQSYANVVNRPMTAAGSQQSTVICNAGSIMAVNSCQLNSGDLNSATIYNITSHRTLPGSSSTSVIDSNGRYVGVGGTDLCNGSMSGNSAGTASSTTGGSSSGATGSSTNIIALANSHGSSALGISLGPPSGPGPYISHDKGLVGVGVGCIDSRKYDFKNNNLLTSNSFQAAQEYVSTGNNSTGSARPNPQTSGLFRGPPPAANTPRGAGAGARHVHMPMYTQPMHQNMVLQTPYPQFTPRQPTFSGPHIQYAPAPIPAYYTPYPYLPQLQQQPAHSRSGVAVNASVGNTMPVQSGPTGPLAGPGTTSSPLQMLSGTVQPGTNTVIGVSSGSTQVGVTPIVGVLPPNVAPQRRHKHRLQIIDPATKKNILDDYDKGNANIENDYQEQVNAPTVSQPEVPICISQTTTDGQITTSLTGSIPNSSVAYNIEQIPTSRNDIVIGQTPVVSAISDAPSVEILPTPLKGKSKKIPIVSPKEESEPTQTSLKLSDPTVDTQAATIKFKDAIKPQQPNCVPPQPSATKEPASSGVISEVALEPVGESINDLVNEAVINSTSKFPNTKEVSGALAALSAQPSLSIDSAETIVVTDSFGTLHTADVELIDNEAKSSIVLEALPENDQIVDHVNKVSTSKAATRAETCTPQSGPESPHESTPDETDQAVIIMAQKEPQEESLVVTSSISLTIEGKDSTEKPIDECTNNFVADESLKDSETVTTANSQSELSNLLPQPLSQSLISYNEGQWSPNNPTGKKQYNRDQLLQLRDAKASRIQPEVSNESILPQPNLMPSFMRNNNNNNKRVQSMVGMIGGNRNNIEVGSTNFMGKQISMPGVQGRNSMKGMIHVNLSLNQDVKLNETENAWRPRVLNKPLDSEIDSKSTQEKEDLVRRVRGILNKLTPEKFDTLVEEIIKLKIDTSDKMDEVIVLVFEKAIDEPNFSVSYARLCHRLILEVKARDERMESGTKSNLAHFRSALLDKTEREFTQNVSQSTAKEIKLQPIVDKIKKCNDPNEKAELEALLEEEERKIRRRSGGTVRFIGELFKISMLTGKIIYSCIDTLLNPHSEDMLECLCKLLTTVGAKFEQTLVNSKEPNRYYSLEKPIARMQAIASKTDKDGAKVSSRVRFMLQDVIDLRKNKWQTTRNEAPKTMGQIEKEAKNEQLSAQYMNYSGSLSTSGSNTPQVGGTANKIDDRGVRGNRFGSESRSSYGGSHSQRGDSVGSNLRHQQQNSGGSSGGSGGLGGSGSNHSNGNNEDNVWHVQTGKGSRSQAVDSIKLEGLALQLNQNLDTKKMGGLQQFLWTTNALRQQSSTPTTTPSNSFAVLSSLIDKNSSDRDREHNRDRDRSGPRNKGSYNKGSIERDRYGLHSRTGSSQGSRENSSSRGNQQQGRSMINTSTLQKSASHSKYTQQVPTPTGTRLASKGSLSSNAAAGGLYRISSADQHSSSTPSSNFNQPVHNITKGLAAPAPVFVKSSDSDLKTIKSVVSEMIELAAASKSVTPSVISCIKRVPDTQHCGFLYYILTDYLHLANVGKQYRRYLAIVVAHLIQQDCMSVEHFRLAYKEFSDFAEDLIVDIPELWLYILQFTGPLIVKKILTLSDLWNKQLKDNSPTNMSKKFLKTYLTYCTREVGPNFTRSMWKKFNLRWSDYVPENEVPNFIESNNLEYVENEFKSPVIEERESHENHLKNVIEHIEHLLKEGATADCIIDYCNGNIVTVDKLFIRGLTQTLSNFSIVYKENSYKLELEIFQKICIPVLQRYIDSREDHQLECLYAMQLLVHSLEHPRGLLSELFGELYDGYVIQKESLCKWRDSKDQSAGKGVAVKSLNPFFNLIFNDEAN